MKVVRRKNQKVTARWGGEAKEKTDKDRLNDVNLRRPRSGRSYNELEKAVCNGDRP